MSDDHPSEIELAVRGNMPVQVTGGTSERRAEYVRQHLPSPLLDVDCTGCDDAEDVATRLFLQCSSATDLDEVYDVWWSIEDALEMHYETLVVENFSALDPDTQQDIAERFKSLFESTDAMLAVTAADNSDLYTANSDLSGRVRTIDVETDS